MTGSGFARTAALTMIFGLAIGTCRTPALAAGTEVWQGQYVCAQGVTDLTLTINVDQAGNAHALFEFHADPRNPNVPRGCFEMSGNEDNSGHVSLVPGAWRLRPNDYVTVGLTGDLRVHGSFTGQIDSPGCGAFVLEQVLNPSDTVTGCVGALS